MVADSRIGRALVAGVAGMRGCCWRPLRPPLGFRKAARGTSQGRAAPVTRTSRTPATAATTSSTTTSTSPTRRRTRARSLTGSSSGVATITCVRRRTSNGSTSTCAAWTSRRSRVDGKPARGDSAAGRRRGRGRGLLAGAGRRERVWELTIQPRPKLKAGQTVQVVVEYGGATGRPTDIEGALYGWVTTRDGAMVVNEPEGA